MEREELKVEGAHPSALPTAHDVVRRNENERGNKDDDGDDGDD